MPLVGTFSTMPLPDLLQWLGTSSKTGTLQVERNRATKAIRVRGGRVIGASSDDPPQRLGQFLLSRRKITERQLSDALAAQDGSGQRIGQLLVEMNVLSAEVLRDELHAKAEEIIYSLFDWDEGVFRFEETLDETLDLYPIDMRVDEVLLRGVKRLDDMMLIRQVLRSPGIVLRYTSKPPGPDIFGDETARAMYSAIDGERTLGEMLLLLHGTEYQVKTFLYDLHRKGYVEIAEVRDAEGEPSGATVDPSPDLGATAEPVLDLDLEPLFDGPLEEDSNDTGGSAIAVISPVRSATASAAGDGLDAELTEASRMMRQGDLEHALHLLDGLYRREPGNDSLRRLTAEAEAAYADEAYRVHLPADRVPFLTRPVESLSSETLTPQEFFMLSRIDGTWDIRSIIQIAPFREVEALRTLKRMLDLGMIELRASESGPRDR